MSKGFTLVEVVLVLAILAVVVTMVIVAVDPAYQLARSRNDRRIGHLLTIINAIGQNMADNNGTFKCVSGALPGSATNMASAPPNYNIGPCLVPDYLSGLPFDPSAPGGYYSGPNDYNTIYTILQDSVGRIILRAPAAELGQPIIVSR